MKNVVKLCFLCYVEIKCDLAFIGFIFLQIQVYRKYFGIQIIRRDKKEPKLSTNNIL